jgi:hypothetical protein
MHGAIVPIAYTKLASNGNITFSNIPQGYQDLYIIGNVRSTNTSQDTLAIDLTYGATEYSSTWLLGDGSSATSNRQSNQYVSSVPYTNGANATAGIFSSFETHILNYANTSTYKTILTRMASDQNGSGWTSLTVGLRRNTAAVTFLEFAGANAVFAAGSTFAIYGVRTVNQ